MLQVILVYKYIFFYVLKFIFLAVKSFKIIIFVFSPQQHQKLTLSSALIQSSMGPIWHFSIYLMI